MYKNVLLTQNEIQLLLATIGHYQHSNSRCIDQVSQNLHIIVRHLVGAETRKNP
jgi:hypothetical protein